MEAASNSMNEFVARSFFLIDGNMAELQLQSILIILISIPNCFKTNQHNFQSLFLLRSIESIVLADSIPKSKLILWFNDYGSFINVLFKKYMHFCFTLQGTQSISKIESLYLKHSDWVAQVNIWVWHKAHEKYQAIIS